MVEADQTQFLAQLLQAQAAAVVQTSMLVLQEQRPMVQPAVVVTQATVVLVMAQVEAAAQEMVHHQDQQCQITLQAVVVEHPQMDQILLHKMVEMVEQVQQVQSPDHQ